MISVSVWAKEQSASVAQDGQFVRDGITTDLTHLRQFKKLKGLSMRIRD